jgi:hypothetical protein
LAATFSPIGGVLGGTVFAPITLRAILAQLFDGLAIGGESQNC